MRSAADIIDALHRAGATLVVEEGKARVRGVRVPEDLLAELKAQKTEVLEEWSHREKEKRDRYGKVPPKNEAAMIGRDVTLKHLQEISVRAYAMRQGRPIHTWIMARATEYHTLGVAAEEAETVACVDLLCWQRNNSVTAALNWLAGIEECVATYPKPKTKEQND